MDDFTPETTSANINELAEELACLSMPAIQAFHLGQAAKHGLWTDHVAVSDAISLSTIRPPMNFDGDIDLYSNAVHEAIIRKVSTKWLNNQWCMTYYIVGHKVHCSPRRRYRPEVGRISEGIIPV